MAGHVHRLLGGDDVRRHQQQGPRVGAAEGVVLAEDPAGQEGEHQPGLDTGTAGEDRPSGPAWLRQRPPGQRVQPGRRRRTQPGRSTTSPGSSGRSSPRFVSCRTCPSASTVARAGRDGYRGTFPWHLRAPAHQERAGPPRRSPVTTGRVSRFLTHLPTLPAPVPVSGHDLRTVRRSARRSRTCEGSSRGHRGRPGRGAVGAVGHEREHQHPAVLVEDQPGEGVDPVSVPVFARAPSRGRPATPACRTACRRGCRSRRRPGGRPAAGAASPCPGSCPPAPPRPPGAGSAAAPGCGSPTRCRCRRTA